jgi:hypothetical protein
MFTTRPEAPAELVLAEKEPDGQALVAAEKERAEQVLVPAEEPVVPAKDMAKSSTNAGQLTPPGVSTTATLKAAEEWPAPIYEVIETLLAAAGAAKSSVGNTTDTANVWIPRPGVLAAIRQMEDALPLLTEPAQGIVEEMVALMRACASQTMVMRP